MSKTATLYRMVMKDHICPFGLKSRGLLRREGFELDDNHLTSKQETEAFKEEHNVDTTPQTFINGKRIGGYDELRDYFDLPPEGQQGTTYTPVISIFATCFLMALGISWHYHESIFTLAVLETFVALSMCALAIQKLRDITSFTNQFLGYDMLSMRFPRYAWFYPFGEAWAGIGMLAGVSAWLVSPIAAFIGTVGAVSVFKAVYIDKRELKCACVGGDSKVPLGFVSLTENLLMILAAVWMWLR